MQLPSMTKLNCIALTIKVWELGGAQFCIYLFRNAFLVQQYPIYELYNAAKNIYISLNQTCTLDAFLKENNLK